MGFFFKEIFHFAKTTEFSLKGGWGTANRIIKVFPTVGGLSKIQNRNTPFPNLQADRGFARPIFRGWY